MALTSIGCASEAQPPRGGARSKKGPTPPRIDQRQPSGTPDFARLPDDDGPPVLDPDAERKTTGRTPEIPDTFERLQLQSDGLTREAVLYVPPDLDEKEKVPLLIGIHGNNGNAAVMFRKHGFGRVVTERRWIGVFPECDVWSHTDPKPDLGDDRFLGTLLDKLLSDYPVDPERVFVVGFSGGGRRAFNLASRYSDKVTAIVVSGTSIGMHDGGPSGWDPTERGSEPVSILQVHGAADTVISARGGLTQGDNPMNSVAMMEGLELWAGHIGASKVDPAMAPVGCPKNNKVFRWEADSGHVLMGVIEPKLPHRWPSWLTDAAPAFFESVPVNQG